MANINTLNAHLRNRTGSNSSKQARLAGQLPAIIYGDGKDPEAISLDVMEIRKELSRSNFANKLYDISLGGKNIRVLVQDIKQNPISDQVEHVDFLRVNPNTKVTIEVPVSFVNEQESPGIKRGGVLNIVRHTIEVSCPVDKIPESFIFDLTDLEVGDSVHISDTKIDEGVQTSIKDRDFTVASVLAPSALLSSASEEDEEGEKEEDEAEISEEGKIEEGKEEEKADASKDKTESQ